MLMLSCMTSLHGYHAYRRPTYPSCDWCMSTISQITFVVQVRSSAVFISADLSDLERMPVFRHMIIWVLLNSHTRPNACDKDTTSFQDDEWFYSLLMILMVLWHRFEAHRRTSTRSFTGSLDSLRRPADTQRLLSSSVLIVQLCGLVEEATSSRPLLVRKWITATAIIIPMKACNSMTASTFRHFQV